MLLAESAAAILANPENHKARCERSAAYLKDDRKEEALGDAIVALEAAPSLVEAHLAAGKAFRACEAFPQAEDSFLKAKAMGGPLRGQADALLQELSAQNIPVYMRGSSSVYTWGLNSTGACGSGDKRDKLIARPIDSLRGRNILDVACGLMHSLVLVDSGQVMAFGQNNLGQCGVGEVSEAVLVPHFVGGLLAIPIVSIACGGGHSAAISAGGELFTWGVGAKGQLGHGDGVNYPLPKRVESLSETVKITAVSCGFGHTMAVANHGEMLFAFGWNEAGQCGVVVGRSDDEGSGPIVKLPRKVDFSSAAAGVEASKTVQIAHIACGGAHTAVVSEGGFLYTFGSGSCGQLGLGDSKDYNTPQRVQSLKDIAVAVCGEEFTVVVTRHRSLYSFGLNNAGQLGIDTSNGQAEIPKLVESVDGRAIEDLAATQAAVLAVTAAGSVIAWGEGGSMLQGAGDLSTKSDSNQVLKPQAVHSLSRKNVRRIACGRRHFVVVVASAAPTQCLMNWEALDEAKVGKRSRLKIVAHDAEGIALKQGGERFLCIVMSGEERGKAPFASIVAVDDNMDGSYSLDFTPTRAGPAEMRITLNGQHILGSPYSFFAVPGQADPAQCAIKLVKLQEGGCIAGTPVAVSVTIRDSQGNGVAVNVSVVATLKSGDAPAAVVIPLSSSSSSSSRKGDDPSEDIEIAGFAFFPEIAGTYAIVGKLENGRGPVFGEVLVEVLAAAPHSPNCSVLTSGSRSDGLIQAVAGKEASFVVALKDRYGNLCRDYFGPPRVNFELKDGQLTSATPRRGQGGGSSSSSLQALRMEWEFLSDEGVYRLNYIPTRAGHYNVEIGVESSSSTQLLPIPGCPYPLQVSPSSLDISKCSVSGPGLVDTLIRDAEGWRTVSLTLRDSFGNLCSIENLSDISASFQSASPESKKDSIGGEKSSSPAVKPAGGASSTVKKPLSSASAIKTTSTTAAAGARATVAKTSSTSSSSSPSSIRAAAAASASTLKKTSVSSVGSTRVSSTVPVAAKSSTSTVAVKKPTTSAAAATTSSSRTSSSIKSSSSSSVASSPQTLTNSATVSATPLPHEVSIRFAVRNVGLHLLSVTIRSEHVPHSPFKLSLTLDKEEERRRLEVESTAKRNQLIEEALAALEAAEKEGRAGNYADGRNWLVRARCLFEEAGATDRFVDVERVEELIARLERTEMARKETIAALTAARAAIGHELWVKAKSAVERAKLHVEMAEDEDLRKEVEEVEKLIKEGEDAVKKRQEDEEMDRRRKVFEMLQKQEIVRKRAAEVARQELENAKKKVEEKIRLHDGREAIRRRTGGGFTITFVARPQEETVIDAGED